MQNVPASKYSKTSHKLNITEKIEGIGNWKEREIIYAAHYSKRKVLYVGNTPEQISECFSKHCCGIKSRLDSSKLTKEFSRTWPYKW